MAIQRGLEDGLALLKPLLDLAPETSTVALMPAAQLSTIHGDPPDPSASFTATAVLRELSEETVERFIAAALADEAAPLVSIELRHLGGRAAPDAGVDGAVTGIAGEGIVFGIGILPFPEALPPVVAAARALTERLRPSAADAHARTFAEEPVPPEALYGAAVGRLREITDRWDPTRRFVLAHALD